MPKIYKTARKIYELADRKYRLSTIMFFVTLFVFVATLWAYCSAREEIEAHHEEIEKLESRVAEYEGCRNPTPSFNPPLRINFSDGRVARVSYNVYSAPILEKYSYLKDDEEMFDELLHNRTHRLNDFMQAKVYSELEARTFDEVTRNREAVSQRILEKAKPLYKDLDYDLLEFNLWEICEVRTLGSSRSVP